MIRKAAWIIVAAFCVGCHSETAPPTAQAPNTKNKSTTLNAGRPLSAPSSSGSNTDPGILPLGGGAMSPVTNPGAVDGAGSGVNEAAKGMAKAAAANANKPSTETSTDGE